jgi:hypothetical protein
MNLAMGSTFSIKTHTHLKKKKSAKFSKITDGPGHRRGAPKGDPGADAGQLWRNQWRKVHCGPISFFFNRPSFFYFETHKKRKAMILKQCFSPQLESDSPCIGFDFFFLVLF